MDLTCTRHIKGAIAEGIRVSEMKDKRMQRKDGWKDAQMMGDEDGLGLNERELLMDGLAEPE